jgi:hypothetical protein
MTNIYSRLKSLDFLIRGQCSISHEGSCAQVLEEEKKKKKKVKKYAEDEERARLAEIEQMRKEYEKKNEEYEKKKSFYQAVKDGEFGGMNTGETEWTEPRDSSNERRDSNTKKKAKESTVDETGRRPDGSIPWTKERQAKFQAEHEEKKLNTEANLGGRPQLTNPKDNEAKKKLGIQGKVGRPEKQATPQSKHTRRTSQEAVTAIEASVKLAEEKDKENKRKKEEEKGNQSNINPKDEKKLDERYGSERIPWVDYTLPKDDGVEKAEEGIGGMTTGAQRGLGHEGGNKQGPGESTQVTEVVEEESKKSAYENHEQDESPDSESNKQQIPPSKPGMDVVKTRLKLLKIKYSNIYKHRKI